jgi:hypothetical protein
VSGQLKKRSRAAGVGQVEQKEEKMLGMDGKGVRLCMCVHRIRVQGNSKKRSFKQTFVACCSKFTLEEEDGGRLPWLTRESPAVRSKGLSERRFCIRRGGL